MRTLTKAQERLRWSCWLLILPFIALCWVPSYNQLTPSVIGIPFFYDQLVWVLLSALVVGIVYQVEHRGGRNELDHGDRLRPSFALVTGLGFIAARWRRGDLNLLHEWGLGGRRFGTVITWFLLGGDLYTAYTFIAVPALAYGAGALAFFAVPYTIMIYPILFLVFPRMWRCAHRRGYVTASDFVRGRFGNHWLALAITITGIVATMPYIALQLVGLQVVIGAMGVGALALPAICR